MKHDLGKKGDPSSTTETWTSYFKGKNIDGIINGEGLDEAKKKRD